MSDHMIPDGLAALRTEMNARLTQMENWLERVTVAVEKLSENRERLTVMEVKFQAEMELVRRDLAELRQVQTELKTTVQTLGSENAGQNEKLARLDMFKAGALVLASALAVKLLEMAADKVVAP